ncbi:MAG: carboxyl transferase domain-containing protein [Candidatus Nanopelagicales bacterium]
MTPPTPQEAVRVALDCPVPGRRSASFVEYDLVDSRLEPVDRPLGSQDCGVVVGVMTHWFEGHAGPTQRVWLAGDPTRSMGAVAEAECRRIIAAFDYAQARGLPVEWVAVSAGARISMNSGTENMDWCAAVVRRILEFTQRGGQVFVIVAGINVGAQSYWNSVATMLNHCAGMLVMVQGTSMVLTGRRALARSGGVSETDDTLLGGYGAVMGPNGQSHHVAPDFGQAYRMVLLHHEMLADTSRPRYTCDPWDRDVCSSREIASILDHRHNPARKTPFAIRPVMEALKDTDSGLLERWSDASGADGAVVWDTRVGGRAVTLIGIESHHRRDADGPGENQTWWAAGTLYPAAAKKIARALNHASGRRPVAVLANLAGFDGSAWSLRNHQLEFGAEIARAVVNFDGPIVVFVIGRFHGGAYVVFNKTLNDGVRMLAVEGTKVSVIGGSAAAEVVLTKKVRARAAELEGDVHAAAAEVAREFDAVHSVERAHAVGSVDAVIAAGQLRPAMIGELNAACDARELRSG